MKIAVLVLSLLLVVLTVALVWLVVVLRNARHALALAREALTGAQLAQRGSSKPPAAQTSAPAGGGGLIASYLEDDAASELDVTRPGVKPADATRPAPVVPAPPLIVEEQSDKTEVFQRPDAEPARDPNAGLPYLEITEGAQRHPRVYLQFDRATIGRDERNTIPIDDTGASKQHCEITFDNNRFALRDNDSTNGTRLNGERIDVKPLEFGDTIRIGETDMVFSCEGFEFKNTDPGAAIAAFEITLERQPNFLGALKIVAFLLERDVARQKEAEPYWQRIMELEKRR